MSSFDQGHLETQTALPEPLQSMGVWNVGNLGLPSTMLSIASALVFAAVFGVLESGGTEQQLFVLPFPKTSIVAALAAALAWAIAIRCHLRPGRNLPRVWALILACTNTMIVGIGFAFPDRSWSLALAVAALASAATLAPRLIKLPPHSTMVQYVAPLSLLMILAIILPSACAVRRSIAGETERRVDRRIQQLRLWTTELNEVTTFDWERMEESPESAANEVAKLKGLAFRKEIADPEVWRSAAILGKDGDLAAAMGDLTDQVVAGFAPERVPKVSTLHEPAVYWDDQEKQWQAYAQFARLSEIAGSYHQELGRLFVELKNAPVEGAKAVDYQQHYAQQRRVLRGYLNEAMSSWPDNWPVFRVPEHGELVGRENLPLDELLRMPLVVVNEESLAPGDLPRLATLPLYRLKQLAPHARGCHEQGFTERRRDIYRLDCYSYAPRKGGTGAELRVEMRLVYQSENYMRLDLSRLPHEVYFHFMIPEGKDAGSLREEVMTALASAVRRTSPEAEVRSTDKGGSVAGGFAIEGKHTRIRVLRPSIVSLDGITPEPKAVRVRVTRAGA